MIEPRYRIQFPPANVRELGQNEVYFYINGESGPERVLLHDYERIFSMPGLYEQVVYDRLVCQSPKTVAEVLRYSLEQSEQSTHSLRVLDLGAGNGMAGEELSRLGVSRLVGVDIIPEARAATERDRPGIYDAYYVLDLCELEEAQRSTLQSWSFDCLVSVAALGFGDIPLRAFVEAYNFVSEGGWVAFNIKETFLDRSDESGFSRLVRELLFSASLDLQILKRYRHRFSLEGEPLYYYAIGGRKHSDVSGELLERLENGGR